MSFSERLKIALKSESVNSFAKKAGISESVVRKYLEGGSLPSIDKAVKIADAANVSVAWLVAGEGTADMGGVEENDFAVLPLISAVKKGEIIASSSERFAYNKEWLVRAGYNIKDLATAIMTDDAMIPTIELGSVIVCDTRPHNITSGIYIINLYDRTEIRRLQPCGDKIKIICDNAKYETNVLNSDEIKIIGKAIAKIEWHGF